ncbi:MAG: hypothetical protein LBG20_01650 [Holosporaceae bacterium]|jgi:hypothetical protein|nr:hypothetical protein [Holosporaceae bacterium]
MEFCAHCAVNMCQNISQSRADKKITKRDLINISCICSLPFLGGGIRQYSLSDGNEGMVMAMLYIKGTGINKARIVWHSGQVGFRAPPQRGFQCWTTTPIHLWINAWSNVSRNLSVGVDYEADNLYKGLKINNGEIKIVVFVSYYVTKNYLPLRIGLLLINPTPNYISSGNQYIYFPVTVFFTPKPGLFSETPPA